jgi:hypothetical protein
MNDLTVTEYQGKRVLTTQQLAQVYETEAKNIQMNFSNNEDRFQINRDYCLLEGDELKAFKSDPNNIGFAPNLNKLYLWTERGANRHSKILDTDKAWQQFDLLEETYFQVKTGQALLPQMSQLEIIAAIAQGAAEHEKQLKQLSSELQGMRDVITLSTVSWREDTKNLLVKIAQKTGDVQVISDLWKQAYKLLDDRMGVNVKQRLTNLRNRMMNEGACKSKRDKANQLDVIGEDKKLIEGFVAIVKEMSIKAGVS